MGKLESVGTITSGPGGPCRICGEHKQAGNIRRVDAIKVSARARNNQATRKKNVNLRRI